MRKEHMFVMGVRERAELLRTHAAVIFGHVALNLLAAQLMMAVSNALSTSNVGGHGIRLPDILLDRVPRISALWLTDVFVVASAGLAIGHALLVHARPEQAMPQLSRTIFVLHVLRTYARKQRPWLTRSMSLAVTRLPDPRPGCERITGSPMTTYAAHRCGDCMFSGHTLLHAVAVLYCAEHGTPRMAALAGLLALCGVAAIVANHAHYTVDIVVAIYTTVAVWYALPRIRAPDVLSMDSSDHKV